MQEQHSSARSGSSEEDGVVAEKAQRRKQACRKYYETHKDELRAKARERAARAKLRRLQSETPEEAEARRRKIKETSARRRAYFRAQSQLSSGTSPAGITI
ncbi:hypothetical protein CVT26_002552 [Gymnopilus dilepis]|uniref:Uncharacterized protein n=1 Tax=Gymnopilus dilepis TaxID=231916 RepID=A0A409Y3Q4_9AGAR|nr:hypothetical protein CVT26_002552 [Gymnopilus dilepis]